MTVVELIKSAYMAEVIGTYTLEDSVSIKIGDGTVTYTDSSHPADNAIDTFRLLSPAESQSGNEAIVFNYTVMGSAFVTAEVDLAW